MRREIHLTFIYQELQSRVRSCYLHSQIISQLQKCWKSKAQIVKKENLFPSCEQVKSSKSKQDFQSESEAKIASASSDPALSSEEVRILSSNFCSSRHQIYELNSKIQVKEHKFLTNELD